MFHTPRVNVIESDAGFSIELLGRVGMQYRESGKSLFIDSEIQATDPASVAIWRDRFWAWDRPHDKEPVTEETKTEILKNVCAALKWYNTPVETYSKTTGWIKGWLE